jgi:hypothetical protein
MIIAQCFKCTTCKRPAPSGLLDPIQPAPVERDLIVHAIDLATDAFNMLVLRFDFRTL